MDFIITHQELDALNGLPHIQRLAYLMGIRPYMDIKTGIVGIKRGISHQSIAEQLYIEPHPGIKSVSFSRAQVRRALAGLEKSGLIKLESEELKLILKCPLATKSYSVQKKAVTNPSQKDDIFPTQQSYENKGFLKVSGEKADIPTPSKAVTPLIEDNYLYLLSQFEKFWMAFPEKKSRTSAWRAFQLLNPDDSLFRKILEAIQLQIKIHEANQANGIWIPSWKYPANWLTQRCWEDEVTLDLRQENNHAENRKSTRNESAKDMFWNPNESDDEPRQDNIVPFKQCK